MLIHVLQTPVMLIASPQTQMQKFLKYQQLTAEKTQLNAHLHLPS